MHTKACDCHHKGESSASCIKPLVLVPDIKLCKSSRKPVKTPSAAAFPVVYTLKITYYYSYSDRMDADGQSKRQYCPNSVKKDLFPDVHSNFLRSIPSDADTLRHVQKCITMKLQCFGPKATNPWHLNKLRAEEAWFTLKTVEFAAKHELTDRLNTMRKVVDAIWKICVMKL